MTFTVNMKATLIFFFLLHFGAEDSTKQANGQTAMTSYRPVKLSYVSTLSVADTAI